MLHRRLLYINKQIFLHHVVKNIVRKVIYPLSPSYRLCVVCNIDIKNSSVHETQLSIKSLKLFKSLKVYKFLLENEKTFLYIKLHQIIYLYFLFLFPSSCSHSSHSLRHASLGLSNTHSPSGRELNPSSQEDASFSGLCTLAYKLHFILRHPSLELSSSSFTFR